jgi:hypothetical protein
VLSQPTHTLLLRALADIARVCLRLMFTLASPPWFAACDNLSQAAWQTKRMFLKLAYTATYLSSSNHQIQAIASTLSTVTNCSLSLLLHAAQVDACALVRKCCCTRT